MMQSGGAGGSGGSGGTGGSMSCPSGPEVTPAQPADHPIYPEPQSIVQNGLGAQVHTACVDTGALAEHAKIDALIPELLADAGLVAAAECCDLTVSFVGTQPPLSGDAQTAWTAAGQNPERYIAITRTADGRATATLHAPGGERGALYALRSVLSLVQGNPARIANATIVDYPVFGARGVVEGFYGVPYTVTDRTTILRLMSRLRENVFIYGPKDDVYARDRWRDPYPLANVGEGQTIQAAAHEADRLLVDFVWSISPGLSFDFGNFDAELATLKAKIDNVRGLGVRRFALFLDDIGNADAAGHARLMNALDDYLKQRDPHAKLITVGTRYAFGPNGYTDTLGQMAHSSIEIMWTGNDIEPTTMTAADMSAVNASLRRKVTIWDNWPNAPGSFTGRSADLHNAVQGYYTNPVLNEDPSPNLPTMEFLKVLGPIADYLWAPERYAASTSYQRWQPLLTSWNGQVAPCTPCGNFVQGWTCKSDLSAILFCDGNCLTALPCPGGCQYQSNPHPDICR
jgi:hyaluronoglucosaminidase